MKLIKCNQKQSKSILLFFDFFFIFCSLFFISISFEKISSFVKTLFSVLDFDKQENNIVAFYFVAFYFVAFILFLFFIYNLFNALIIKIFFKEQIIFAIKRYLCCSFLLLFLFSLSFIFAQKIIFSSCNYDDYVSRTESIIDSLSQDQSFSKINIYVEHVPYLINKKYKIKTRFLPLNYLNNSSSENIVFTDSSNNYYLLNYQGYSYIRVSDELSIYTNSKKIIDSMSYNGYEVKPYYVYSEEYDLAECAEINKINLDSNGFISLDINNPEVTIPPLSLFSGNYHFDFDLELIEDSGDPEICGIEFSFDLGKTDYQFISIGRNEFIANRLVKTIIQSIPNKEGLVFRIVLKSNSRLLIKHFTITKY